jgi:sigma-B regulation protein RsbU (phosphoserine phosphatase)
MELERANARPTLGHRPQRAEADELDAAIDDRSALVVDDDAAERVRLEAILEGMGLRVVSAADGVAALGILHDGFRPGIIVSDWRMPDLDGIELCQHVRGVDSDVSATYFILVTGNEGRSAVEDGLNAGADDFIAKPYRAGELRARVDAGRRIIGERAQLAERNSELHRKLAAKSQSELRLQSGLDAAASIQKRQLPPRFSVIDGVECGQVSRSAEILAGDGAGCFSIGADQICFFLLDVAGHGVSAALNSFAVARALSSRSAMNDLLVEDGRPRAPSNVVRKLNEQFRASDHCDDYFTIVYGFMNTRSGHGLLCQAGHPHPVVVGRHGEVSLLGDGGYPVGLLDEADYHDTQFQLACGDRLALFSDGILEAGSSGHEPFGYARLTQLLASLTALPLVRALDAFESRLLSWQGGRAFDDDISLLVIGRPGGETEA